MAATRLQLPPRVRDSLLLRPALFVVAGVLLGALTLWVDSQLAPTDVPAWLHFDVENARLLYATLAGALLTVAGITFWVRSASVSLAAGQYSANVVMGFLEDWFQQSVMSLMLGLFAYVVTVFRVLRPEAATTGGVDVPHLSVLVGIVLSASSVVFVMGAIRNAVRSMYAGALGRRISDTTVDRIRRTLPVVDGEPDEPDVHAPTTPPLRIRARDSGWVTAIDEDALLDALPAGSVVQLEVRVGLYALEARPLAQVWADGVPDEVVDGIVRDAVTVGRRSLTEDIEFGVTQLVDLAVGSLTGSSADVTSAYEVTQHLELVLWELGRRNLRPRSSTDAEGRVLIRGRHITYDDYVRLAFDRLRRAAVPYPTVSGALIELATEVGRDLEDAGFRRRAHALRRQVDIILEAAEGADVVDDDLAEMLRLARRGARGPGVDPNA